MTGCGESELNSGIQWRDEGRRRRATDLRDSSKSRGTTYCRKGEACYLDDASERCREAPSPRIIWAQRALFISICSTTSSPVPSVLGPHISATSALDNTSNQLTRDVDWLRNTATWAINVTGRDDQLYVAHRLIADSFVASRTIQRKAL